MKTIENLLISSAFKILSRRLKSKPITLSTTTLVKQFLLHKLITEEREIFGAIWLDVMNRLIAVEDLSLGTINQAVIFPREILKSALRHNAAHVIFYHSHPSGDPGPSAADKAMTVKMKDLLLTIEVDLLDHVIVSGTKTRSFAENGEL